jgi:cholinesterase
MTQDPLPAEPWTTPLDCTKEGPACYHFSTSYNRLIGDEDCLHINLFTKNVS